MPNLQHKEGESQRTIRQNKALHLLFTMLADELNAHGMDLRTFPFKKAINIPWTGRSVKEYLWRPVQKAQLLKTSTTELTTKDIDAVFDTLNRYLGEATGLHVPFPSMEEIIFQQSYGKTKQKKINSLSS